MESQESTKYRNPIEYLKVFFRRKWYLISATSAGLVLGIVACLLLPPTYESSTTILVEEERTINPLFQNLAVSTTAEQRMQSIREILLGWNSLVELTKKLNLDKDVQNQAQFEGLIKGLRRSITVIMRQPNIIQISYLGKEPQETQLVAKTLTDILVAKNMEEQTKQTDVAIKFIQEQLAVYKRKVKESEVATLEDQLKTLLIDSTEQHPMVQELRQKINLAKKQLDSGEYKIAESTKPLDNATRDVLKKELDSIISKDNTTLAGSSAYAGVSTQENTNNAIYKLLLMDKVDSARAQDIGVNERIYNDLLQRLETAKITQRLEASKEGTRYTIIDPPRLPLTPSKPKKIMVILLGLFFGATSGTGLVFGREFLDHSFLDIEDAKLNLELPILGAISRLTTQEEIDKEKYKKKKLIVLGLSASGLLIFISILIYLLRK